MLVSSLIVKYPTRLFITESLRDTLNKQNFTISQYPTRSFADSISNYNKNEISESGIFYFMLKNITLSVNYIQINIQIQFFLYKHI